MALVPASLAAMCLADAAAASRHDGQTVRLGRGRRADTELPLQIFTAARGAGWLFAAADQKFHMLLAFGAVVFVDGHIRLR